MLFKQIEKILGKFGSTQLGLDLAKAFSAITDAGAKIWEVIGPILVKLLGGVLDILSGPVMGVLWLIAAIYDKIRPYILKIVDALLVVVDKIKTLWTIIKDGLGITKGEKKAKFEKIAEETEYKYVEGKELSDKYGGVKYTGWLDSHGDIVKKEDLPANLKRAYEDYLKAPDSVFSQVGDYLEGILANVEELFAPVLNPLTDAINRLCDWLGIGGEEVLPDVVNPETGNGRQGDTDTVPGVETGDGLTGPRGFVPPVPDVAPDTPPTFGSWEEQTGFNGPVDFGNGFGYNPNTNAAEAIIGASPFSFAGHAEGVTFTRDGLYTGKFHGPEEVLSRESTIKGPGIIARAIGALEGASRNGQAIGVGGGDVHIHVTNDTKFDFAGSKIDSSFDIQGFLREVDKRIESGSKKAVERAIGQGRT
jgi:hypothetical protein